MIRKLSILISLFLSFSLLNAQGLLHTSGQQIVNDDGNFIIKSIGTGNWMIMEGYMMQSTKVGINTHTQFREKLIRSMGEEKTNEFYAHWLENHFTKRDLDSMKTWGFNALRPALHYKWFTLPIEDEPIAGKNTWINKGFDMVDSLMAWAEENQMYIILDMHGAPGGQGKNADINDYDPALPSLWESKANQDKLLALWVKLAERYKDNPWIGGYDLINEPNWSVDGTNNENGCDCINNDKLWDLHQRLTEAVRKVDKKHIIYISGNCWGNNYNSFENHPLNSFDDNTVITFHKYWDVNNQDAIQKFINMREKYNLPLWMSESGENSNLWFADAIHLFESNNIGWSWWPVKKSRTNNIFKVSTPQSYYDLIDSWEEGVTPLTADNTFKAAMDYSNAHKLENCTVAYDVINAMLNNTDTTETLPFKKHNLNDWIACVDYDMGRDSFAYHDVLSENINTDEHRYRAWNEGKTYRNDGVDIAHEQGHYYVGWTDDGEWLQYTLNIEHANNYDLIIESSAKENGGILSIEVNGKILAKNISLPKTGEETKWETTIIENVELPAGKVKIKLSFTKGGSNLKAFKIIEQ